MVVHGIVLVDNPLFITPRSYYSVIRICFETGYVLYVHRLLSRPTLRNKRVRQHVLDIEMAAPLGAHDGMKTPEEAVASAIVDVGQK